MASKLECSTSDEELQLLLQTDLSVIIRASQGPNGMPACLVRSTSEALPHSCLNLKSL
jgi:hypothetical protein